jgi:tetratricopeptide (TPR) repeat protein
MHVQQVCCLHYISFITHKKHRTFGAFCVFSRVIRLRSMSLLFWKDWNTAHRLTYLAGLSLLAVSLVWFGAVWYRGLDNVVSWQVLNELVGLPASLHTVTDGLLTYPVRGQVQTVVGQFWASPMQVHPVVAVGTLVGISAALALLLAGLCQLPALYYRLGMAAFILLLAVCRFDILNLPGSVGKWFFIAITVLFGGVSYYVHTFRTRTPFAVRTGIFAGLLALTAVAIESLSGVTYPAQLLLAYALPGLLVLSIVFIIWVALEPIVAMVWLTSTSRTDGRPLGLYNFLFVSVLYLLNLLLIWLKNSRNVDVTIVTISPFLIVGVSMLLGIWGVKRLAEQRGRFPFAEAGAGVYIGLATLATLTIAYAFATANDPLIEVFEDAIVYSHFAMGVAAVLYTVLNFWPIYQQQLPVHRVFYKARLADWPLFWLAGIVGMAGMVGGANYFVFRQGQAALQSAIGDAYLTESQLDLAQTFYQQSVAQEFQQHKANYALASMALLRNDQTTAAQYFTQALQKQPSPQAFAGLSDTYRQTNLFFESIKTLQRGIRTFPNSGELRTNLGYLYSKTAIADSAYFYLQSAAATTAQDDVPLGNLLALYAKNPALLTADSTLLTQLSTRHVPAYEANALAVRLIVGTDTATYPAFPRPTTPTWLATNVPDSILDAGRFASLYNYAIATPKPDSALIVWLENVALHPDNQQIVDELLLATALACYKADRHPEAFERLTQLAENGSRNRTAYCTTLGLLELEQAMPQQAAETFGLNTTDTLSMLYQAVSLLKTGDILAAKPLWEVATNTDPTLRRIGQVVFNQMAPTTDREKAFYVKYRPDDLNRGAIWETIKDPSLKTVAGAALIETYLQTKQPFYAQMILSQMGKPAQLTPFARSMENLMAVQIAAFRQKPIAVDSLAKAFLLPIHQGQAATLRGRTYAATKRPSQARQAYETALRLSPANGAIVAEAATYLRANRLLKPAYAAVLRALPFNEKRADLLKTYVLLCADQSLFEYAEDGLVKLNFATTPADYQAFEAAYQQKLSAVENQRQQFTN